MRSTSLLESCGGPDGHGEVDTANLAGSLAVEDIPSWALSLFGQSLLGRSAGCLTII